MRCEPSLSSAVSPNDRLEFRLKALIAVTLSRPIRSHVALEFGELKSYLQQRLERCFLRQVLGSAVRLEQSSRVVVEQQRFRG